MRESIGADGRHILVNRHVNSNPRTQLRFLYWQDAVGVMTGDKKPMPNAWNLELEGLNVPEHLN
jgi:hypothetical protein